MLLRLALQLLGASLGGTLRAFGRLAGFALGSFCRLLGLAFDPLRDLSALDVCATAQLFGATFDLFALRAEESAEGALDTTHETLSRAGRLLLHILFAHDASHLRAANR